MKVICINNKPLHYSHTDLHNLVEGKIYEVLRETKGTLFLGYELKNVPCSNHLGYRRERFIPLSEIDEMKLVNSNTIKEVV
jgi:hypothetical protein